MSFRPLLGVSTTDALVPSYHTSQIQLRPLISIDYLLYKIVVMHVLWCYGLWVCLQLSIETTKYLTQLQMVRDELTYTVVLAQTLAP